MSYQGAVRQIKAELGDLLEARRTGLSFEELKAYKSRFVEFCRDIFGIELTPQQLEGARALMEHRQIIVQGGNAVGKDTLTALWALYEVYVVDALAILSGPTDRQVREILMRREVGRLWRLADGKLPGERYEMAIRIPGREEGGLLAFTASDPEKFVGHHSALGRVFIGITEAQAIPAEIFEAAQRCQPTRLLAVCNPTSPSCAAYRLAHSSNWVNLRWSALDHPNVTSGEIRFPGATTRQWVEAMRAEHGETSRFWCYAVLAHWPEDSDEALIRLSWLRDAEELWEDESFDAEGWRPNVVLGLDVARLGPDSSVLAVRQGMRLRKFHEWTGTDTVETAARAEEIARGAGVRGAKDSGGPVGTIVVDAPGIGGGVIDQLRARGLPVKEFNGARRATDPTRYANQRAESHCRLRTLLEERRIGLPRDARLREEALGVRSFINSSGLTQIESKDEIRGRLGRSPDRLDAAVLCFSEAAEPPARYFAAGSQIYDIQTMRILDMDGFSNGRKETKKMKRSNRNEIANTLAALGRAFQTAGSRIERELVSDGVGARYEASRRLRYAGPAWIGYECGFKITLPGIGIFHVASEACVIEDGLAEITVDTVLDREQEGIRRSLSWGSLSKPNPDPRGPEALWNARGLVATEPKPIRAIALDLTAGVVRADPPGLEVRLHEPGPDELPCSEQSMAEFLRDLLFTGLGIRELTPETRPAG